MERPYRLLFGQPDSRAWKSSEATTPIRAIAVSSADIAPYFWPMLESCGQLVYIECPNSRNASGEKITTSRRAAAAAVVALAMKMVRFYRRGSEASFLLQGATCAHDALSTIMRSQAKSGQGEL